MFSGIKRRIREYLVNRFQIPSIESSFKRLAECGFSPKGVYDVGAYQGDFAEQVLKFWPNTHVTCFEPQVSRKADLLELCRRYPKQITYQNFLLGAEQQDSVKFHVAETGSSVLANSTGEQPPTIQIPMTTIDVYRQSKDSVSCNLLKLDVQGYELEVLRGATSTLASDVEVILAELNFLDIYANVPLVHETLAWLAARDFVAYDISSLIRRPLDQALWQADVIFVRTGGELRKNKLWSKP